MSVAARRNVRMDRLWYARTQSRMRASSIVISNEFLKGPPQVPFIEREEIVQAFASDGPHHSFAVGIGFGCLGGGSQHSHSEIVQRAVERRRKDRIAIVDDEPVRMQVRENLAELLGGPFRGGMSGDIAVQNPA